MSNKVRLKNRKEYIYYFFKKIDLREKIEIAFMLFKK